MVPVTNGNTTSALKIWTLGKDYLGITFQTWLSISQWIKTYYCCCTAHCKQYIAQTSAKVVSWLSDELDKSCTQLAILLWWAWPDTKPTIIYTEEFSWNPRCVIISGSTQELTSTAWVSSLHPQILRWFIKYACWSTGKSTLALSFWNHRATYKGSRCQQSEQQFQEPSLPPALQIQEMPQAKQSRSCKREHQISGVQQTVTAAVLLLWHQHIQSGAEQDVQCSLVALSPCCQGLRVVPVWKSWCLELPLSPV